MRIDVELLAGRNNGKGPQLLNGGFPLILLLSLLISASAFATGYVEPLYRDLDSYESEWKACYNFTNPEFQRCVDRVAKKAQGWSRDQMTEIRKITSKRVNAPKTLAALNKMEQSYGPFHDKQCEFESHKRSGQQDEIQLQRARCRFRRAFSLIIHLYDDLKLFGTGAKSYDETFFPPSPVTPQFKSAVERRMYEIGAKTRPCFKAAGTNTDEQLKCSSTGLVEMNLYLNERVRTWLPELEAGSRGALLSSYLKETHESWKTFRQAMCTFVLEYYLTGEGGVNYPALRRNQCEYRAARARIVEMFQLR